LKIYFKAFISVLLCIIILSSSGLTSSLGSMAAPLAAKPGVNLLPVLNDGDWYTWSPLETLKPDFQMVDKDGNKALLIDSKGKFENYGEWMADIENFDYNQTFNFSIDYYADKVNNENLSVFAILTWKDSSDQLLRRDTVEDRVSLADDWKRLSKTIKPPLMGAHLFVELVFRWSDSGKVYWRAPALFKVEPVKHKKVKVATILARAAYDTLGENLAVMLRGIDVAAKKTKADVLCLSENQYAFETNIPMIESADTIPGTLTKAMSGKAKLYKAYIIFSMLEKDRDNFYQTAVLIDRSGKVAGKYRKTHIPIEEAERGWTPGNEYPVFKTDFGTIGLEVCWDHWFPEVSRILADKGAEIIFIPSMGYAPVQASARAVDNGIYVVVSDYLREENCRIINPQGNTIAQVNNYNTGSRVGYAVSEIDLDDEKFNTGDTDIRSTIVRDRRTTVTGVK
jgi:predicted amidohydrolase